MRRAWFDPSLSSWNTVSTLPKDLREELEAKVPWSSVKLIRSPSSKTAVKALFELHDGKKIESVLMVNSKGQWTACLSSQVGCAMACDFCATGSMGFFRDLTIDEIVDQLRYWQHYLFNKNREAFGLVGPKASESPYEESPREGRSPFRVSNVVMMGMGEPLNNYQPVRDAMRCFIEDMDIGKTKITLSTVGVKRGMEELLDDPLWPDVRVAISLHYANQTKRLEHMPVAKQRSLDDLHDWCLRYLKKFGNRKHHLTFEYLMLQGKNDGEDDIEALRKFLEGMDHYKLNLIPWNVVNNLHYNRASRERTEAFQQSLEKHGIFATIRKSLGIEIDAGCGQLAVKEDLISL